MLGRRHGDMEGSAGRVVPTGEQVLAYWFVFQTKGCVEIFCRCDGTFCCSLLSVRFSGLINSRLGTKR